MDGPKPQSDGRRPGMRVLVVDDNRDTARMMRLLLLDRGYEVKLAFTGREAIGAAEAFRPDVVLLDLTLPDLSGAEVAEELRGAGGLEAAALVAVSGYGPEQTPPVFDAYFAKPVDHEALNAFLSRWAGGERTPGDEGTTLPPATAAV